MEATYASKEIKPMPYTGVQNPLPPQLPETPEEISIAKIRAYHEAFLKLIELTENGVKDVAFTDLGLEQKLMIQNLVNSVSRCANIVLVGEQSKGVRLCIKWDERDSNHFHLSHTRITAEAPTNDLGKPYIPA